MAFYSVDFPGKVRVWLCSIIMLVIVGAFGALPGDAYAESPIRLAMITARTGEAGKTNSISFLAARFVVDEINNSGGILGRKVELIEYDNKSSAEGSAAAARKAIDDGVVAVVGCNWSSHSIAMAKVLQEARVPMISHMSTNPTVTLVGNYIFRICFTDSFQGLGLARFSRVHLNDKTAVVLVDESRTYSVGLGEAFSRAFEQLGGKVLWQGRYSADNIPYYSILKKIAEYNPDALFVPGGYTDVAGFFGKARDMGARWHLLSADGIGPKLYERIGNRAHGVFFSAHWSKWVGTDISKQFVLNYEKKVGVLDEDTMALVYDSFMVLREAIERAQSTNRALVKDAIAMTPGYEGVTGVIRFDLNGDPIKPMVINELKFGGVMYVDQVYP